jgi:hypothetical protein
MLCSRPLPLLRNFFDYNTQIFAVNIFHPTEFIKENIGKPKAIAKISVIGEKDMFGIIEDSVGCGYRITSVK